MNVFDVQMAEGRVHRYLPSFDRKVAFAVHGIEAMLAAAPRVYVSISFGKQSLCLAHMVYQVEPRTPMHFLASEETWSLYNYADVIDAFVARWPINLTVHQTARMTGASDWKTSRDVGDRDLQEMCPRDQWDGWFWGLAVEESPGRKKTLLSAYTQGTPHPSIFRYADGKLRCCPLMHWTVLDLAAYIGIHNIPILNIYRRFGLHQRTTARVTKKMLRNQGMALARMCNSNGFRRIVNHFQEINVQ